MLPPEAPIGWRPLPKAPGRSGPCRQPGAGPTASGMVNVNAIRVGARGPLMGGRRPAGRGATHVRLPDGHRGRCCGIDRGGPGGRRRARRCGGRSPWRRLVDRRHGAHRRGIRQARRRLRQGRVPGARPSRGRGSRRGPGGGGTPHEVAGRPAVPRGPQCGRGRLLRVFGGRGAPGGGAPVPGPPAHRPAPGRPSAPAGGSGRGPGSACSTRRAGGGVPAQHRRRQGWA